VNNQLISPADKELAKKVFIYFSQLMDRNVTDQNGALLGELYDIIVKPSEVYPQSDSLIIRKGFPNRKYALVENIVDFLVYLFDRNSDYLNKEYLISWKHIQPLSINPVSAIGPVPNFKSYHG
jgi:sporulation protein YlmC with PRC-barrel domain